jgi:hypothetical protein
MDAREIETEISSSRVYDRLYPAEEIEEMKSRVQDEAAKLVMGIIVRDQYAPWDASNA